MSLYLDSSAVIATLKPEKASAAVTTLLTQASARLVISRLVAAEVASTASRLFRIGEFTRAQAELMLANFDRWRMPSAEYVAIDDMHIHQADILVRRFQLKLAAPDAIHIAVAQRVGATLVTLDDRQAAAARALGLDVVEP